MFLMLQVISQVLYLSVWFFTMPEKTKRKLDVHGCSIIVVGLNCFRISAVKNYKASATGRAAEAYTRRGGVPCAGYALARWCCGSDYDRMGPV